MTASTYEIVGSALHDDADVAAATAPARAALTRLGSSEAAPVAATPHAIVVATGGTERSIVEAAERCQRGSSDQPVLLVAHPLHNSLPAALEALAHLRSSGIRGRVVFIDGTSERELADALTDLRAWHRLHTTRLGLIGPPSDWLVASTPTAATVTRRWGPELVDVPVADAIRHFSTVPVEVGRGSAAQLGGMASTTLPAPGDVEQAGRLDSVLRTLIDEHRLDAVTVRCFDFIESLGTTGCVAVALLNADEIVAGCEGDVPAALALLWSRHLLDRPGWIANPSAIRPRTNELVLAHCTIAPSMVRDLTITTHFESGRGVGLHGRLRAHRVTLVRIGGAELDRHWIAEADVIGSGNDPALCRTQATVVVDDADVHDLLDDPLGNHLVVIEGSHRRRLERWWEWAIAPTAGESQSPT